jgi:hypothetical protein
MADAEFEIIFRFKVAVISNLHIVPPVSLMFDSMIVTAIGIGVNRAAIYKDGGRMV